MGYAIVFIENVRSNTIQLTNVYGDRGGTSIGAYCSIV
jgi:hypothetical protein